MTKEQKELIEISDIIINKIKSQSDTIIHRYVSYSTNSVYLKFDYGVANSLRISDHEGKRRYSYRYNLLTNINEYEYDDSDIFPKEFYPLSMIDSLVNKILNQRQLKVGTYKNYSKTVEDNRKSINPKIGFWKNAKEV